jgi:hypothetical protein
MFNMTHPGAVRRAGERPNPHHAAAATAASFKAASGQGQALQVRASNERQRFVITPGMGANGVERA